MQESVHDEDLRRLPCAVYRLSGRWHYTEPKFFVSYPHLTCQEKFEQ